MCQFEQFIITGLLLAHPHNYSEALRQLERAIVPRDVKRALDYIHDHLDEPITLADLVRTSQVAGRTFLKHFRDFKGTSPMRYLRDARLDRVREALARANVGENVCDRAEMGLQSHWPLLASLSGALRRKPIADASAPARIMETKKVRIPGVLYARYFASDVPFLTGEVTQFYVLLTRTSSWCLAASCGDSERWRY
jgi:AraC-like DNA-binding protein